MNYADLPNLHTHTSRCKHATGAPHDYCVEAKRLGFKILGFSDHQPFPDGTLDKSRMPFADLELYIHDVELARQEFPEMTILLGLESDYLRSWGVAFYQEEFFNKRKLDYLILGPHFSDPLSAEEGVSPEERGRLRVENAIRAMSTGLFSYLAHPDMFASAGTCWTPEVKAYCRDLIETAISLKIPLEINAHGMSKPMIKTPEGERMQYPWRPFWELVAELGATIVIGSDAHKPNQLDECVDKSLDWATGLGLQPINTEVATTIIARKSRF